MTDQPQQPSPANDAKLEAEARKLDAESRQVEVEIERIKVETRKLEAEAAAAAANARRAEMALEDAEREEAENRAGNRHNRVYHFMGPVDATTVKACLKELGVWARLSDEPIEIVFSSPGGSIVDGLALYDFILALRQRGIHVTTSALGMAASMAGILLQAGDVRRMGPETWLLIHEAAFGSSGKIGEIEDTVDWVKRIQERVLDIFASRSSMRKAQIRKNWQRRDWWISSDEALQLGFIDAIG